MIDKYKIQSTVPITIDDGYSMCEMLNSIAIKLNEAIIELNKKEMKLTAGTNVIINRDNPEKPIISALSHIEEVITIKDYETLLALGEDLTIDAIYITLDDCNYNDKFYARNTLYFCDLDKNINECNLSELAQMKTFNDDGSVETETYLTSSKNNTYMYHVKYDVDTKTITRFGIVDGERTIDTIIYDYDDNIVNRGVLEFRPNSDGGMNIYTNETIDGDVNLKLAMDRYSEEIVETTLGEIKELTSFTTKTGSININIENIDIELFEDTSYIATVGYFGLKAYKVDDILYIDLKGCNGDSNYNYVNIYNSDTGFVGEESDVTSKDFTLNSPCIFSLTSFADDSESLDTAITFITLLDYTEDLIGLRYLLNTGIDNLNYTLRNNYSRNIETKDIHINFKDFLFNEKYKNISETSVFDYSYLTTDVFEAFYNAVETTDIFNITDISGMFKMLIRKLEDGVYIYLQLYSVTFNEYGYVCIMEYNASTGNITVPANSHDYLGADFINRKYTFTDLTLFSESFSNIEQVGYSVDEVTALKTFLSYIDLDIVKGNYDLNAVNEKLKEYISDLRNNKENLLTAGDNIDIVRTGEGKTVISASGSRRRWRWL